jgi:beta-fructofuranosidase
MRLFRKPDHADATGDAIPFFYDGKYHIFSLTPPPGTGTYPERLRTTWHHTASENLVNWDDLGPALLPGSPGEPDADGCWTGSVLFGEGMFHAFYTGYSIGARFPQTICHAFSADGLQWTKNPNNPCLVPRTDLYESLDWRDPYAFYNDDDQCYWMILSARRNSGPIGRRGCVILYRSRDLAAWEYYGAIYEPNHTNCPECPEMYRIGDSWYLSYSRFSEFGGTIYRISDNPFGGWRTPRRDRIGSRRFYAAKSMADDKGGRYYFGWTPDRAGRSDQGEWFWGGIFAVPHAVSRSSTAGELEVALPQAIADIFRKPVDWIYRPMEGESAAADRTVIAKSIGSLAYGFFEFSEPRFLMSCKVRSIDCRDSFGFAIKSDKNLARTLLLMFEPAAQRVSLLNYPMPVDPFWEVSVASMVSSGAPGPDGPRVADESFAFQDGESIDMKILVDHDLIEVFVGEKVALNYRWYDAAEFALGVVVQDGSAEYEDITIAACM